MADQLGQQERYLVWRRQTPPEKPFPLKNEKVFTVGNTFIRFSSRIKSIARPDPELKIKYSKAARMIMEEPPRQAREARMPQLGATHIFNAMIDS